MGLLGRLFGTVAGLEKGLDMISKGADALHYSPEEKSEMAKSLQDEFTPRAITRRILAVIVILHFFLHVDLWVWFAWRGNTEVVGELEKILGVEWKLALTVIIFYFGYYGVKSILKTKK